MLMQSIRRFTIASALAAALVPAPALAQPRTLRQHLAALETAHEITILLHPSIRVNAPVAERVDLAAAEPALRALLRGYDFFLQYAGGAEAGTGRLRRVWVFPRGAADGVRLVRDEELAGEAPRADFSTQFNDALTRSVEDAQGLVSRALEDTDENVRQQAVEAILRETLPVPDHVLEGVFLGDPSDTVRAAAFDALAARAVADGVDVTPTIDRALQDPSALVNDRARALLESLGADSPPPVKPGGRD